MLIELWERMRGYDKWVETEATIESCEVRTVEDARVEECDDLMVWTDRDGMRHRAEFTAGEGSPLFQLLVGSTVAIRYNPADPEEYYLRDLQKDRVSGVLAVVVRGPLLALLAFFIWLLLHSTAK